MFFADKLVVIVGNGVSGKGAFFALEKSGAKCSYWPEGAQDADLIVVSPGIPPEHPCFSCGLPVLGEFAVGALLNDRPVAAVTGTNGKTTTCEMLNAMLKKRFHTALCGNIGRSFAETAARGSYDIAVTEVSSFQLEHIEGFRPAAAAILNISPDHLNRYPDFTAYARTKLKIAQNMRGGLLVLNADGIPAGLLDGFAPDADVRYVSARARVRGAYAADGKLYLNGRFLCERSRLKADGDHNVANALTAALMAAHFGVTDEEILQVFSAFEASAHRMREIGRIQGVTFYNDSKGTNPASTLAALQTVDDACVILGGSDKGIDYDELFAALPVGTVTVILGATTEKMTISAQKYGVPYMPATSMRDAVEKAYRSGCSAVVLSPAAASFDAYSNYAERGEDFIRAVTELENEEA